MVSKATENAKICSNKRGATYKPCDFTFVSRCHVHLSLKFLSTYTCKPQ